MNVAVTGPVKLSLHQASYVRKMITVELKMATGLISGCAEGVDAEAAWAALKNTRVAITLTRPGELWHDYQLVSWFRTIEARVTLVNCPSNYMKRNDETIRRADKLVAFPETLEEELRSGTWATIRRARKKGIPVSIYPLENA